MSICGTTGLQGSEHLFLGEQPVKQLEFRSKLKVSHIMGYWGFGTMGFWNSGKSQYKHSDMILHLIHGSNYHRTDSFLRYC